MDFLLPARAAKQRLRVMGRGESGMGFKLSDQLIVGTRLPHRQINVEAKQWDQAYDRHIVRSRANLPKLSPVHKFSENHVGTAALGCPSSEARSLPLRLATAGLHPARQPRAAVAT